MRSEAETGLANPRLVRLFQSLAGAAGVTTGLTGVLVLAGWALDIPALKSVSPGLVTMKANTAMALALAGASLWLEHREGTGGARRRAAQASAFVVALAGLLTLAEYLFGWDLGIDELLFKEVPGALWTSTPGRMAPATALSFLVLGLALLILDVETRAGRRPAQLLGLAAGLTSLVGVLGYVYGPALSTMAPYAQMALHTAVALTLLGAGVLLARPHRGLMAIVTSDSAGGLVARRLFPAAVLTPILLGWLRMAGQRAELYQTELGLVIMVFAHVVVFSVLVWASARSLHRIDSERQRALQESRAAEARFRTLLEEAPDGIIGVDRGGRVALVNDQAERLFGYSRDEMLGQPVETLLPERFRERHLDHRGRYLSAPSRRPMGAGLELYGRRKDGTEFPAEINLSPLEASGGLLITTIVRDITERKRAETALARQAEELARSNAELQEFAYVSSHDLQEPLRTVASFTQLLAKRYRGRLDAEADEFIDFVVEGVTRMQALISDLLEYSRVGTRGGAFEPADTKVLVETALANLKDAIERSDALVTLGPLPVVTCDPGQVVRVFQNLVGNALKFRRVEPPRVQIAAERNGGEWVFSVRDNGIGIDSRYATRIFTVFQRLHTRTEYGGTGIGLAICKKVVARHGGRIWVESKPGKGSTFLFTIPAERGRP